MYTSEQYLLHNPINAKKDFDYINPDCVLITRIKNDELETRWEAFENAKALIVAEQILDFGRGSYYEAYPEMIEC